MHVGRRLGSAKRGNALLLSQADNAGVVAETGNGNSHQEPDRRQVLIAGVRSPRPFLEQVRAMSILRDWCGLEMAGFSVDLSSIATTSIGQAVA